MEVSNTPNSSLAVAAYALQQQQQTVNRSRDGDRDTETVDANRNTETRRTDSVNISDAAQQLNAQNGTSRSTVNPSSDSSSANNQPPQQQAPVRPEVARSESAATAAQALNAYRSASLY